MNINMLENGIDSLHKGFKSLTDYEKTLLDKTIDDKTRFFILKDAITYTHHGIEIMMKHILYLKSEYLIFSNIDKNLKNAYQEKNQKKLNNVFETSLSNRVHTITYEEAFERLKYICNFSFSKKFEYQIEMLGNLRNQITHAEITANEVEVKTLFDDFLSEIDKFFFNAIGMDYKTVNGYSTLVNNYDIYIKLLDENGLHVKKKVIECFVEIFKKLNFGMGFKEVKRITDINVANLILNEIINTQFVFGADFYNGHCSGQITHIKRVGKEHLSIFSKDNNLDYQFKFSSLVIYMPDFNSSFSPIFIFEAAEDINSTGFPDEAVVKVDYYKRKFIEGMYIYEEKKLIYDPETIYELYARRDYDDNFVMPQFYDINHFLDKGIFCFLNIQGLKYGNFRRILREAESKKIDGVTLTLQLKKYIND